MNYTPHVLDGEVDAIAVVGNKVILGGQFTQAQNASGGPVLNRANILAFDKNTGVIDTSFVPNADGRVRTLVPGGDGQSVYVGGQFNTLGGQTARKIARLNINTGQKVAGFNPGLPNALVYDAKLQGNRLFIAGQFTKIGNNDRSLIAELDATSGALRPAGSYAFAGTHHGGQTLVYKIDVNSAGMMVAIGNFATVNGQARVQIAALDASGPIALLDDWRTSRYEPMCYSSFDYYIRDVDFSPDGSYFVVNSTGGYGSGPPTLCDTSSRWTASDRGQAVNPIWVNYAGGDSYYANAVTGAAVYIGGHNRWLNNPFAADGVGPGAVDRQGIAAQDPKNGVPLAWDPGRTRGRGVFDMVSTPEGLWVGSDTDRIGGFEYHGRIAFFPVAGGAEVPQPESATLPVDAYTVGGASARYLYRVNTGGDALGSLDAGPDWAADTDANPSPYRNSGSNAAGWSAVGSVDGTVPASTPTAVFSAERWDPGGDQEMAWDFPAAVGKHLQVRLYLANRYDGTSGEGARVYDIAIDGTTVLDNYDIVADVGHNRGTMKSFDITSDGNVDIDFGHVVENPLINAIEIIDLDAPADPPTAVTKREFDGDDAGSQSDAPEGSIDWSTARGAFVLDGQLYLASSTGTFTRRSFDGTTYGAPTTLDLHGLTQFQTEMSQMTSLVYADGSIFFTLGGDANLYRRAFSVESGIVGAQRFTVSSGGIDWRQARGAFVAEDGLYWSASATGDLHRVTFTGSLPGLTAPQAGTDTVVSGPSQDGTDWRGRVMFTLPGPPPNQPPTASFTYSCAEFVCSFTNTSTDSDGTIATTEWNFGDGDASSAADPVHEFDGSGTYTVTLAITDDDGAPASTSQDVVLSDSAITFVGANDAGTGSSGTVHQVTVPATVQAGDSLVLAFSMNSRTATITGPAGWSLVEQDNTNGMTTAVWTRTATAGMAGSTVTVGTGSPVKDTLVVAAYRNAAVVPGASSIDAETVNRAQHTTPVASAPAGAWVVSIWSDKTAATSAWTAPGGQAVRLSGAGTGAGHLSWLVTDSNGALAAGSVGGLTATADSSSAQATMTTVVLAPSG